MDELHDIVHLPAASGQTPELRAAVKLLDSELATRPRPGNDAVIPALLDTLLLYLLRSRFSHTGPAGTGSGWSAALTDPAIAKALEAMHTAPAKPWTVADLAAHVQMSRAAFSRRFTRLVGRPPLSYLTWWRLTTAARLLTDTDEPLAAVSARVG